MGKRTIRILRKDLSKHLETLPGKEVHVIGRNAITYFGVVETANSEQVTIRDANSAWYNRKMHLHTIPMASIYEILYDLVTEY